MQKQKKEVIRLMASLGSEAEEEEEGSIDEEMEEEEY